MQNWNLGSITFLELSLTFSCSEYISHVLVSNQVNLGFLSSFSIFTFALIVSRCFLFGVPLCSNVYDGPPQAAAVVTWDKFVTLVLVSLLPLIMFVSTAPTYIWSRFSVPLYFFTVRMLDGSGYDG